MNNKVRIANLDLLVHKHSSRATLAKLLDIEYNDFIKYFKNKNLEIPDKFARQIEARLNKPLGWMDADNINLELNAEEWLLIKAYRQGNSRDRIFLVGLAKLII